MSPDVSAALTELLISSDSLLLIATNICASRTSHSSCLSVSLVCRPLFVESSSRCALDLLAVAHRMTVAFHPFQFSGPVRVAATSSLVSFSMVDIVVGGAVDVVGPGVDGRVVPVGAAGDGVAVTEAGVKPDIKWWETS